MGSDTEVTAAQDAGIGTWGVGNDRQARLE